MRTRRLFGFSLLVTLWLFAACTLDSTAPTPTPAPTLAPTPTATFPVMVQLTPYENDRFGYRIMYLTGLPLEEDEATGNVMIDNQITIQVTGVNPTNQPPPGISIGEITETTIAGEVSRRYSGQTTAQGGRIPQNFQVVSVPHNGLYYVFTVYELKIGEEQPTDRVPGPIPEDVLINYAQITSSLEFYVP